MTTHPTPGDIAADLNNNDAWAAFERIDRLPEAAMLAALEPWASAMAIYNLTKAERLARIERCLPLLTKEERHADDIQDHIDRLRSERRRLRECVHNHRRLIATYGKARPGAALPVEFDTPEKCLARIDEITAKIEAAGRALG